MRKIKYLAIALTLFSAAFVACEEDSDELTGDKNEGGLVEINTPIVGYVVGNGVTLPYDGQFTINQGTVKTTKVDIYKSFTDSKGTADPADDVVSNEVLLQSIDLSGDKHEVVDFTYSYNDLIQGLILDGAPLSTDDQTLNIGDFWTVRFSSTTSNGVHLNAEIMKIAVGTRFAGQYKCVNGEYYRIGVFNAGTGSWPAVTVIESVTSTLYRVKTYFGIFTGNEFYFNIDANDIITYPANRPDGTAQVGNGQPMITCQTNPADMSAVHCGDSNYVTRDDVNGKDKLTMSFGYYTTSGAVGPRTFYQVLEKL
ncbi:MAG: hypothetical protein V4670_11425 [Bacteroidota bacterium]